MNPTPDQEDYRKLRRRAELALLAALLLLRRRRIEPHGFGVKVAAVLYLHHAQASALGRGRAVGRRQPVEDVDEQRAGQVVYAKDGEVAFLAGFVQALRGDRYRDEEGEFREKVIAGRLALYALKLAGTANEAFVLDSPEELYWLWLLGPAEHCPGCLALYARNPYKAGELWTYPGQSDLPCKMNCKCTVLRSDGLRGFTTY